MLPSSVSGAVITAGVAVVLAVAAQLQTWHRARTDRAYERRRVALLDVQDAALILREELRAYGEQLNHISAAVEPAVPGSGPSNVVAIDPSSRALALARGRLDVYGVRIDPTGRGATVAAALDHWRTAVEEHFLSPGDVSASSEKAAWSALHLQVAAELVR